MKLQLRYESEDNVDIIDWATGVLYEPPFTCSLADEEVKSFYEKPLTLNITSPSVVMERTICDIDALSTATTSEEKRDGMIRALHKHRKIKRDGQNAYKIMSDCFC